MSQKIKIVVVTENQNTQDVVQRVVDNQAGIEFLGCCATLDTINLAHPDVVLVDGHNEQMMTFCGRILTQIPKAKIVLISDSSEERHINQAIGAGITGVVLKQSLESDVVKAINSVSKGHYYLSAEIADAVVAFYRNTPKR
jgi:DNA-binding NarL/FixJ family response regulator